MIFYKMHSLKNSYLFFVCEEKALPPLNELSKRLSDYHSGVGSDGVILLSSSTVADFKFRIFNADGQEGRTCGNGLKCATYLWNKLKENKKTYLVETKSGINKTEILRDGLVGVEFSAPSLLSIENSDELFGKCYIVDVGNLHAVYFGTLSAEKVSEILKKQPKYSEINVEKVDLTALYPFVSFFENGSGYTYSCGSGTVAVAYILRKFYGVSNDTVIESLGGKQTVSFKGENPFLIGKITEVFQGEINL